MEQAAGGANFRIQTVLSDWRGRTRTSELEEAASKLDWVIETDQGGHRRAISRTGFAMGAAHIQKQTVRRDLRGGVADFTSCPVIPVPKTFRPIFN